MEDNVSKSQELGYLKQQVEEFINNSYKIYDLNQKLQEESIATQIKDLITSIKGTDKHEEQAKLIEILTEAEKYTEQNFFHHLFKSSVELNTMQYIFDICRYIKINEIYLTYHASKADNYKHFPLDYCMKKAAELIKAFDDGDISITTYSVNQIRPGWINYFMRENSPKGSILNGFDAHYLNEENLGILPSGTNSRLYNGKDYFDNRHNLIDESHLNGKYKFFKSNDQINKISIKVALLNGKDLMNTSTSFEGETLSRLEVINALYKELTEDNKKRLDSDPCLNGKSVNLFIKE